MPELNEANVRHLLRRTEIVDRADRVRELLAKPSFEAAVDDVMNVEPDPPSASFAGIGETWRQGVKLSEFWLDRMATVRRPFAERMAFFWHGHICSEMGKVNSGPAMREQIDLLRREGLGTASNSGDVTDFVRKLSTQVAMLRYLDNVDNYKNSPNQNFARELMELFLLGVGNYTEADVEAATAAWTGHGTPRWDVDEYVFTPEDHEPTAQRFLGKKIPSGRNAGYSVIEVILGTGSLGSGTVPVGKNKDRPTAQVAAEFLTRKLWQEFGEAASGSVPDGVRNAMTKALLDRDFEIRPWVRAMLLHEDFYNESTKSGLVRQPVEFVVALMVALGLDAAKAGQLWMMERAGQQLLYPPNVSGWKPNGYWVNASAMGARQQIVQGCLWKVTSGAWGSDNGYMELPGGRLDKQWLHDPNRSHTQIVDRILTLTGLVDADGRAGTARAPISQATRQRIIAHLDHDDIKYWQRLDALLLALSAPEMHIA